MDQELMEQLEQLEKHIHNCYGLEAFKLSDFEVQDLINSLQYIRRIKSELVAK